MNRADTSFHKEVLGCDVRLVARVNVVSFVLMSITMAALFPSFWLKGLLGLFLLINSIFMFRFGILRRHSSEVFRVDVNADRVVFTAKTVKPVSYGYNTMLREVDRNKAHQFAVFPIKLGLYDGCMLFVGQSPLFSEPIAVKADEVNKIFDELREYLAQHPVEGGGESGVTPTEAPTVANNQ